MYLNHYIIQSLYARTWAVCWGQKRVLHKKRPVARSYCQACDKKFLFSILVVVCYTFVCANDDLLIPNILKTFKWLVSRTAHICILGLAIIRCAHEAFRCQLNYFWTNSVATLGFCSWHLCDARGRKCITVPMQHSCEICIHSLRCLISISHSRCVAVLKWSPVTLTVLRHLAWHADGQLQLLYLLWLPSHMESHAMPACECFVLGLNVAY
jgi:hypothetical protein